MRCAPLIVVIGLASGCGGHIGSNAGKGAIRGAAEQAQSLPPEQRATVGVQLAKNVTRGVLDELAEPESQRKIANLVALATSRSLATALNPSRGRSPEWVEPGLPPAPEPENGSLDALAARAGRAAVQAAFEELARHPELAHQFGEEVGRGAIQGANPKTHLVTLLLGFAGGALLATLVMSLIRPRRPAVEVRRHNV